MTSDTDSLEQARELLKQSRHLLDEQEDDPEVLGAWMTAWSALRPKLAIGSALVKQLDAAATQIRELSS